MTLHIKKGKQLIEKPLINIVFGFDVPISTKRTLSFESVLVLVIRLCELFILLFFQVLMGGLLFYFISLFFRYFIIFSHTAFVFSKSS